MGGREEGEEETTRPDDDEAAQPGIIGWYLIPIYWDRGDDPLRLYCPPCADALITTAGDGDPQALAAQDIDGQLCPLWASDYPRDTPERRYCWRCGIQIVPARREAGEPAPRRPLAYECSVVQNTYDTSLPAWGAHETDTYGAAAATCARLSVLTDDARLTC